MKARRTLTAVVAAAFAAVTIVGCSSTTEEGPATDADADISGEVTVLTPLWASDSSKADLQTALAGFYEEYPDVTVSFDYTDYGKLNEKVTTGIASGLLPDIIQIGIGWIPPLASKGVLAPLDDYGFSPDELAELYPEVALEPGQYDGATYAIPFITQGSQLVYRKDYFQEAGLDPDKPPATWGELREAAIKTTVRASDGTLERAGFSGLVEGVRGNFSTFLWANGGQVFSEDNTEATFNSPEGVEALEFMDELVNTDKVVDVGFESGAPQNPIVTGKSAIALYQNYIDCGNAEVITPEVCEQLAYAPLPGKKKGDSAVFLGGTLSALTQGAKNPKAAAALLRYFTDNPDVAFSTAASVMSFPSAKSAWTDPRVAEVPSAAAYISYIDVAGNEGGPITWLDTRNDFQPALESVLLGGEDAQTALDTLAAKADADIAAAQ